MRKHLLTALQIAVTVVALWIVFHDPQRRAQMWAAISHSDPKWIVASLLASGIPSIMAVLRWNLLLRAQGVLMAFKRVIQLYMVGRFFDLLLVGSTGGDAVKIFYVLREPAAQGRKTGAVLSIVMDRIVGLMGLVLIATVVLSLRYRWLTQTPTTARLAQAFGVITIGALLAVPVAAIFLVSDLSSRLPAKLPGRAKLLELLAVCRNFVHSWKALLACLCFSIPGHCAFFLTFYFAARAVHAPVSLPDMSSIVPIVNAIVSLPISVSGVGVRENLFSSLLHDLCGVGPELAVPISMIGFICTATYSLIGGIFYLFFRSQAGPAPNAGQLEALPADG